MDNLENQIRQFWENETTPEQRREILRQLEASGMEWKDFLQQYYDKVLAGEEVSSLSSEQKNRVWQRLQDRHAGNNTAAAKVVGFSWRKIWLPWMAAACVIAIVGLCIFYSSGIPSRPVPMASRVAGPTIILKKNTGAGEESLTLPDHSLVMLAPGSTIRYQDHFEARSRNIQLEGRALFEVAKDSIRPFTVTARGFATTALGTRFIVDATRPVVSIRLLKGKVVVNATAEAGISMQKVFLVPGQELKINTEAKYSDRLVLSNKQLPHNSTRSDEGTTLSFERTSLAVVFQRLSLHYKIPILYNKAEVQGLSFTGDFKPADELGLALNVICNMNHLSFTKESNGIVIKKPQ